jgi:hypothetical protein
MALRCFHNFCLNWIPQPLPQRIKDIIDFWERLECQILEPAPNMQRPHNNEQTLIVRKPLNGKIAKPPPPYSHALDAANRLPSAAQRWYYRRKIKRMRKCPLMDVQKCYFWCLRPAGQKKPRQWRTYRAFRAGEVEKIAAALTEGWDADRKKWRRRWNRRRPCSRSPKGVYRGPLDERSVKEFRARRKRNWIRKAKQFIYRNFSYQQSEVY